MLGTEYPDTDQRQRSGICTSGLGKYEKAEEMHRALEGSEKVLGTKHSSTLASVNYLTSAPQNLGRYEEAEEMHRRALNESGKSWG